MRWWLLLALFPSLWGIGCASFQRPTAAFAEASQAADELLARELDAPHLLCRQQLRFDWLQRRLDPAGKLLPLQEHYLRQPTPGDPGDSEGGRCDKVRDAAAIFRLTTTAMSGYAAALAALAGVGSYDVPALAEATTAAGAATQKLTGSGMAASIVGGVGDPLRKLVDLLLQYLNRRAVREGILLADAPLRAMFDALSRWVVLTTKQLDVLQTTVSGVLRALESRLGGPDPERPADVVAYLTLHDFASRSYDDLERARKRQAVYADAVADWRAAYEALQRGTASSHRAARDAAFAAAAAKSSAVLADRSALLYLGLP